MDRIFQNLQRKITKKKKNINNKRQITQINNQRIVYNQDFQPSNCQILKGNQQSNSNRKQQLYSDLKYVNCLSIQKISKYQTKIRQAIQKKFKKSKIKEFKYEIDNQQHSSQDSQDSQDIQSLKPYVYLKKQKYANIYNFHLLKQKYSDQKKSDWKQKRKLRINYYRSKEKRQTDINSTSSLSIRDEKFVQKNQEKIRQNDNQMTSFKKQMKLKQGLDKLKWENKNLKFNQNDFRKPITSRKIKMMNFNSKHNATNDIKTALSIRHKNIQQKYQNNQNSYLNDKLQEVKECKQVNLYKEQQDDEGQFKQTIDRNNNKQIRQSMKMFCKDNGTYIKRLKQVTQKSFHSLSQQKWKLQQISFRFKPIQFQKRLVSIDSSGKDNQNLEDKHNLNSINNYNYTGKNRQGQIRKSIKSIVTPKNIKSNRSFKLTYDQKRYHTINQLDYQATTNEHQNEKEYLLKGQLKNNKTVNQIFPQNNVQKTVNNRRKLRVRTQSHQQTYKQGLKHQIANNKLKNNSFIEFKASLQSPINHIKSQNNRKNKQQKQYKLKLIRNLRNKSNSNRYSTIS